MSAYMSRSWSVLRSVLKSVSKRVCGAVAIAILMPFSCYFLAPICPPARQGDGSSPPLSQRGRVGWGLPLPPLSRALQQ